jgi:CDP-glucose 4,6-dehydratase
VRFLITGHTGFKGAWLSLMLAEQGHLVSGVALDPRVDSLFTRARVADLLENDVRLDIRDYHELRSVFHSVDPDVVIHMAAQSLVRTSYEVPRDTVEINVIGTINVMDIVRQMDGLQAQLIVTTDKVYRNIGQALGYVESDALGGHDPYSASKAAADLLAQSWVASFAGPPTAIARAGNVIGGGDVCDDRLLPDLVRAFESGSPALIRYPSAIRPWQHVLDCLAGYVTVIDSLIAGTGRGEWNFGPGEEGLVPVSTVADIAALAWNAASVDSSARWQVSGDPHPYEQSILALDSRKAETDLGWRNTLPVTTAVQWTIDWWTRVRRGEDPRGVTVDQVRTFGTLSGT